MPIIIVGINTNVGKTLVSAVLAKKLQADYWKPIQTGCNNITDSQWIQTITNSEIVCHPEAYTLSQPLSPHKASELDSMPIYPESIHIPQSSSLIIETSGGFLSPFTRSILQGDFLSSWSCQWILVSRAYLGSLNHTFLTLEAMRARNLPILGLVNNGYCTKESAWLQKQTQLPLIGNLQQESNISYETINYYAESWNYPLAHLS